MLRHYPTDWDMQRTARMAPDVFAEKMEEVTRLFKQYEQNQNEA
jgi:hypothetical protein